MAELLTPADFQLLSRPLVVDDKVGDGQVTVELRVESVRPHPSHRFRAEPFSLVLAGPHAPTLPQGIYRVRHPALGLVDLFLVPISRDAETTCYEVVFN